jgi:hypothetical protein
MYYKAILKRGAFLIAAAMLSFAACKRGDNANPALTSSDDNGGYASDAAKLEQYGNDAMTTADLAVTTNSTNLRTTTTYPTITRTTSGTDTVVTIDFGPTDHLCADLRNRRGQIIVTYSGHYKDSLSTHTITTNGYYVNDFQTIFHKTVTNMGTNTSGQVWYTVTVNDSIVLATDSVISWTGNRTRTWLAGYSTSDRSDDVYAIGGTTVLTRANGHVFTCTISSSSPLTVALACTWIESGIITVSSSSFAGGSRTLDYGYGGGGCDDKALLTIGTHTYVITMW